MKLLTKELLSLFAKYGNQDDASDPMVIAKFFTPDSGWTWFATEYYPENEIFFGYVVGQFPEWGSFSLNELKSIRGCLNLWFEPKRFSELKLDG